MLELKNNKQYYCCTYLYIVNAVISKLLLISYLKCDLATNLKYIQIYIYAFSRRFYPKRLTVQFTFIVSICVPWESNPQPFALLTQCSTTEPQEHITLPLLYVFQFPCEQRFCAILLFNILGVWIDRDIICLRELIWLAVVRQGAGQYWNI